MLRLDAVFWDYPEFTDEERLRDALPEDHGSAMYRWFLTRFLEHGRVVDTLRFFDWPEIRALLPDLRLSRHAREKWTRLIEVYVGA